MKDLKTYLIEHDIPPSLQRIKILEFLVNHRIHPTADQIFKGLADEIPTLSKTTVYNTLKTFEEKGILQPLIVFENEIRYDYDTQPHAHFKCVECGEVYDIYSAFEFLKNQELDGHLVSEHHITLKGICKNCKLKKENY